MPHPAPLTSLFSPLPSPLPSGGGLRLRLRHDRRREDEARRRRARVWHQDDPLCPLRRCAAAPLVAMHRGGGSFQTRPASPATDSASHAHTPCPYVPARKKRKLPLPTAHAGTSSNRNLTNYELAWPHTRDRSAQPNPRDSRHARLPPPSHTPPPHATRRRRPRVRRRRGVGARRHDAQRGAQDAVRGRQRRLLDL